MYEITKGYEEGKLMRKGCRSIKSRAILGSALVLSRGRIPSPQENSGSLAGVIEELANRPKGKPRYAFFNGILRAAN
jgi:hypothetical protein